MTLFSGVVLSGAKKRLSTSCTLEEIANYNRLSFHSIQVLDHCPDAESPDETLILNLKNLLKNSKNLICFSVPLSPPPCHDCLLSCPGIPGCKVHEVLEMRFLDADALPHTERLCEVWIRENYKKKSIPHEIEAALGSNKAPLYARMRFLQKHVPQNQFLESRPRLILAEICSALMLDFAFIQNYKQIENGSEIREEILNSCLDFFNIFIYESDLKPLIESHLYFEGFLLALTAWMKSKNLVHKRPDSILNHSWIEIPLLNKKISI